MEIVGGSKEAYASHIVDGNSFEDAPASGGNIKIHTLSADNITGVIICNNYFSEDGTSIYLSDANATKIHHNFFYGAGTGIDVQASAYNTKIHQNALHCTTPYSDSGVNTVID